MSSDGAYIAIPLAFFDDPESSNWIVVIDGRSGEEVFRTAMPSLPGPERLAIDRVTNELIAALFDGRIQAIDLDTRQVVSEVQSGAASQIQYLSIRDDGLLVLIRITARGSVL